MTKIAISQFKAKCLSLLEEVQKTRKPIRVTRFGRPVADIVPIASDPQTDWIGSMKGTVEILGDVVSPANDESDWEALRD
jgi:prevent-host-death family protein